MNRLFYFSSFFIILPFFCASTLWGLTVDELQKKMAESDLNLQTLEFNFTQEAASSLAEEKRRSSGAAYVQKPKKFRIEQVEPEKQLLISDGKSVYVYTPRFNQVVKDSYKKWFSKNIFFPGMSGFSNTLEQLNKEYLWVLKDEGALDGEKTFVAELTPFDKDRKETIKLWIDRDDFIPRKTELVSETLTLTTTVNGLKRNEILKPELFKFSRPEKSEMISIP